ncbi:MAG: TlpA disulfide reductase family protein [Microthrixaceae bacterium]
MSSRGQRRAPLIAGIVGCAVFALVLLFVVSPKGGESKVSSPLLGKLAPALSGATLASQEFNIDSLRGQWVLVNFFATWCPPCVVEHPELIKLSESSGTTGLSVVSVAFDDSSTNVAKFFADNGGDWPVLTQDTGAVALDYGVKGLPESFLIDPAGKVAAKFEGGITAEAMKEYLAQFTGEGS